METETCFSYGVQKSDKFDSYSLPLNLKNDSEALRNLKDILQKCKEHSPESEFSKFLYEMTETTRIYPKLKYFNGEFNTSVYENDIEIDPRKYLGVYCNARALIHVEGILLGEKTSLLVRVLEVEVSERKGSLVKNKERQLSKKS